MKRYQETDYEPDIEGSFTTALLVYSAFVAFVAAVLTAQGYGLEVVLVLLVVYVGLLFGQVYLSHNLKV